jgi:hypothetical protein
MPKEKKKEVAAASGGWWDGKRGSKEMVDSRADKQMKQRLLCAWCGEWAWGGHS